MLKILLIQPKMQKRPMDTSFKTSMSPSLALLTLLNLTSDEHEVCIINENIQKICYDFDVDLVGITITLDVLNRGAEIAKEFMDKGIPVIAGGIHINCDPDNCEKLFTSICVGPAERVWGKILYDVEKGEIKSRYSDFNDFKGEEIVSPKYSFPNKNKYLITNVLLTSRGCQNKCAFCYNSSPNCVYVKRPINDVIRDIKEINKKHIFFIDDNFISDINYAFQLLEAIKPLNIRWGCAITTNIYNHINLLDKMAEVGCQSVFIGFESINVKSIKDVNKPNNVNEYEDLISLIHERGIMVNASMVFGLDGDKADVFQNSIDWLVKMKIETLTSHILTPYPGTKLYEKMIKENRISCFNLSQYNTSNVVFKPMYMTDNELMQGYLKIYKDFYSIKNIINRMPLLKKQRRAYLIFNICYRKYGVFFSILFKFIPMRFLSLVAEKIAYKN